MAQASQTERCPSAPPPKRISGVRPTVRVETGDIVLLAEEHAARMRRACEALDTEEAVAHVITQELVRLRHRVRELERQVKVQKREHDAKLEELGTKYRAAMRQLRRSYQAQLEQRSDTPPSVAE